MRRRSDERADAVHIRADRPHQAQPTPPLLPGLPSVACQAVEAMCPTSAAGGQGYVQGNSSMKTIKIQCKECGKYRPAYLIKSHEVACKKKQDVTGV